MEIDLARWAVMAAALALGAVIKGATGMGLPLIALPVLASTLGLQHAVGVLAITMTITNAWQTWSFRQAARDPGMGFMPLFLLAGGVGVVIGTWALSSLPERALLFALGCILLGYIVLRLAAPHWVIGPALAKRLGPVAGIGGGILQGATGISAPIGVTFIHAMGFDRVPMVYAVSTMFLVFGLVQLPALVIAGVMQPQWLLEGLFALIPIFIFMPLGQLLASKLSRKAFDRMMLAFLGLIGLKLVLGV